MALREYKGEVLPLNEEDQPGFREYAGQVIPLESEVLARSESLKTRGKKGEEKYESEMVPGSPYARHEDPYGRTEGTLTTPWHDRGGVGFLKAAGSGVYNAVREGVKTGFESSAGINDAIDGIENPYLKGAAKTTSGLMNPVGTAVPAEKLRQGSKFIDENIPEIEQNTPGLNLVQDAAQIGTGVLAGAKGTGFLDDIVTKGAPIAQKVLKYGIKFLAGETGAGIAQDSDDATLFINAKNTIPGLKGWKTDGVEPTFLQHKADLIQESLYLGAAVGGLAKGAGRTISFVSDLIPRKLKAYQSLDAYQKKFVDDLLTIFADVDPDTPRKLVQERMSQAVKLVEANQKIVVSFGEAGVQDVKRQNDTISAMIESLDPSNPHDRRVIEQLEGLRSSALSGGSPDLSAGLKAPKKELDTGLDQLQKARGGDESIATAKDKIVEYGQDQVRPYREKITDTRAEEIRAKRGIEAEIAENPAFQEIRSKQPGENVSIDFTDGGTDISTQMTKNVRSADVAMTKRKNELYDAIPETAQVNTTSLGEALTKADSFIDDALREKLDEAGGNFKKLYQLANVDIEKEIQMARSLGTRAGYDKADALRELKKNITDDQLDYMALPTSGDQATAEAATAARDYFKNEYATKFRDGPLEDMQRNSRFKPETEALTDNRSLIEGTISDPKKREYTGKILDTLATKEGGESAGLATDFALYQVASEIRKMVNTTKKLTPEAIAKISTSFDRFIPILKKNNPGKIKEIEGFLTSLRDKNFDAVEIGKKLDGYIQTGKQAEDRILGEQLGNFFKKGVDGYTAKSDGYEIFADMMSSGEKSAKLSDLVKTVDDPVVRKGLQTAWAKSAQDKLFSSTVGTADLDENFIKIGKEIYGDESLAVDAVQQLVNLSQKGERANKVRMTGGLDTGSFQAGAVRAVEATITAIWGVLNPTAARLRIVSKDLMRQYNPHDEVKKAADMILSNAPEFTRIAREMMTAKKNTLSREDSITLFRIMLNTGVAQLREEDQDRVVKELMAGSETTDAFREKE